MPEIYADWKSLEPLTKRVPAGTRCVVIDHLVEDEFELGEIVTTIDSLNVPNCKNSDGIVDFYGISRLALRPADYQAEPKAEPAKAERKVVQIAVNGTSFIALCDDGTAWALYGNPETWHKLPRIPQD